MNKLRFRIISLFLAVTILLFGFAMYRGGQYRKAHPDAVSADQLTKNIIDKANSPSPEPSYVVPDVSRDTKYDNSTCSKLNANLRSQEILRKFDWDGYQIAWKGHLNSQIVSIMNTAVTFLGEVYQEDVRMFGWASKMPQCFTRQQNKVIQDSLTRAKANFSVIGTWYDKGYLFPNDMYPNYISVLDFIKQAK